MIRKFKNIVLQNLINIPGYRTNRKIIVFESDDWGSIRMASKEVLNNFKNKGFQIDSCPYDSNDRIESNKDLEALIDVLYSVKNSKGQHPKFTLNNIVANPDFNKIKESNFQTYFYEPFTTTLRRYPDSDRVLELYKVGINNKVFQIQFHGREHLNIERWMNRLKDSHESTIQAFNNKMFSIHKSGSISGRSHALDAFGNKDIGSGNNSFEKIIKEGIELFNDIWGFNSKSFIAPCYTWNSNIEPLLKNGGVQYIQGSHVQIVSAKEISSKIERKYHYTGQRNKLNQIYLVRNVSFEPTENGSNFNLNKTLKDIEISFKYKKPAIISTHRVNYIGSINNKNREDNLLLLTKLLNEIVRKWPMVEFMSSDELGEEISR
jgi:hypothetical protein